MTRNELSGMSQRNKFSDYLPWVAYDEETKVYVNSDDTIGFLWECMPLSFAGEKTFFTLEGLFRLGLPANTVMQFTLYADKNIASFIEEYERGKQRDIPIVHEATHKYTKYFADGVDGMKCFLNTPVRNFRLFVALKFKPGKDLNLKDIYNSVTELLAGASLYPRDVTPPVLIDWMRRVFNDEPSLNNDTYDKEIPINKQVIFSDTVIKKDMSSLQLGNKHCRCITAKYYPKEVHPFQTNELFGGVWGIVADANQITTPFMYTLSIVFQDMKNKLHFKCNMVLQQELAGSFAPVLMRKKNEYMWAVDEVEKGTVFVRVIPEMWVWSDNPNRTSESVVRAKRLWEAQGYTMQEDKGILPILFISALPFGLYMKPGNLDAIERDRTAPAESVAHILPIQADFAGGGKPELLFIGRKGQPCALDIFDRHANNHNAFIAATSGSGKSFLVNFIASSYFASNAILRIIDIGGSYKKMTKLFNARYLDFTKDSDICMNPFTFIQEPDSDLQAVSAIVTQMAFSSTDVVPDEKAETASSLIKAAVKWAWDSDGTDANIDRIYQYLNSFPEQASGEEKEGIDNSRMEAFSDIAHELAFNLTEYINSGIYGKWFNGPSNFDISNDEFVVLELEHLKQQKELFKVITLQVINGVTQDLYLSDRTRPRLIIFDEAWQFLGEGNVFQDVIESGYRRARKYHGSFSIITQSILDLKQFGKVGDVIRANSAFKFYLESSDFEKAKEEKLIDLDDFAMQILKSVRSNRPKYSEIFMDTPFGLGVGRLAVDPFSYYLYTSDASEISQIGAMVDSGLTYTEAINEMVKQKPAA
ncbi:MAG: TraC family protein [Deltaproteobacteria bacterium]|nr:TraC family protein [Deltaproteobacteria bacterium]